MRKLGLAECLVDHRQDSLDMRSRGDLRNHASIAGVQIALRRDDRPQHVPVFVNDGGSRFVAGCFECQQSSHVSADEGDALH